MDQELPPRSNGDDESPPLGRKDSFVDRKAIRKSRRVAAKRAKREVKERYQAISLARPKGSLPADQVLSAAVALYRDGPLHPRDLKGAIAKLEVNLRREIPDLAVIRSPRTVSKKPERVGLMVYETRAFGEQDDPLITVENHSVVLEDKRVIFVSGLMPGGTRPHLFERVIERGAKSRTMADVLLRLSNIWPTLLWMRAEQRTQGRGAPIKVMMTPFSNGLLFGNIRRLENMPRVGPTVAIVTTGNQEDRRIHDFYGDAHGNRIWAMTNTYVDEALLAPEQLQLRDMLRVFVETYPDVIADNNWRWRVGLGADDPAVELLAKLFKIHTANSDRRQSALSALEEIVASETWQEVAAGSIASQSRSAR